MKKLRRIAKKIAPKYTFGYYDTEDIEQECFLIGMQALDKYDPEKGSLDNFLYTHINNRMKTFLRDNYVRQDFECKYCGGNDPECEHCLLRRWRFEQKKHLMEPIDINNLNGVIEPNTYTEPDEHETLVQQQIFSIIDTRLDISLRPEYLKMKEGSYVPKHRREYIIGKIREILIDEGYLDE